MSKANRYNSREIAAGRLTMDHLLRIAGIDEVTRLVLAFQRDRGIDADGMAGPETRAESERPAQRYDDVQPAPPPWGDLRIRPTSRAQAVANFLAWVGKGTYALGGGADVFAESPVARRGTVDCSGLTAWCSGHNRAQFFGSLNTSGMLADAKGPQRVFRTIQRDEPIEPGDLIVKGWKDGKPGHTGGVVEVKPGFVRGSRKLGAEWWKYLVVVHSTGPERRTPSIVQTLAGPWKDRGEIIRPRWYVV